MIFPYISLYTQAVAYTMYVESAAEALIPKSSQKHIKKTTFELGKPVGTTYWNKKGINIEVLTSNPITALEAKCSQ